MGLCKELIKDFGMDVIRSALKVFCILPIKKNRVIFDSYVGHQYSCNPKYISEGLLKTKKLYEIIWAFEKPEEYQYLKEKGIKVIRNKGLKFWFYRMTAKVTVTNVMWKNFTPVRSEQYEIQTWHGGGGGYKKTLADDKGQRKKKITLKRHLKNFERYSLVLTSSETSLRTNARMAMKYKGVVLGGTPRNDILINQNRLDIDVKVRGYFHISSDTKIALYAPTWRDGAEKKDFDIDYKGLKEKLSEKFGGSWVILRRFHWMAAGFFKENSADYVRAESYPDMQELLYTVDILISDYSSSIWDFSFTGRPCFLLCFDLEKFKDDRDFYNPINTWGFPVAQSNFELMEKISRFDQDIYLKTIDEQHKKNNSFESGHATENVCRIIESMCFGDGELPKGLPYKFYEEDLEK